MDIHTLATDLETDVKTLRKFLRLPEWSAIEIERLHPSSIPQMKYCFDLWHKPAKIKTEKTDIPPIPKSDFEYEQLSLSTLKTRQHRQAAERLAREQEGFLQRRLADLGRSGVYLRKCRKLGNYDTSRIGEENDDDTD